MIILRPKMPKPPPPVPPRPSKTLVAEALAKKRLQGLQEGKAAPVRAAPPPPTPAGGRTVVFRSADIKSKESLIRASSNASDSNVNVEPQKCGSDPQEFTAVSQNVTYLSQKFSSSASASAGDVKKCNGELQKKCSIDCQKVNVFKKCDSFERNKGGLGAKVERTESTAADKSSKNLNDDCDTYGKIKKKSDSFKINNDSSKITETCHEEEVKKSVVLKSHAENTKPSNDLERKTSSSISSSFVKHNEINHNYYKNNHLEDLQKDKTTDRNYVNTLIDEMFATVLESTDCKIQNESIERESGSNGTQIESVNNHKILIQSESSNVSVSSASMVLVVNGSEEKEESSDQSNASTGERKRVKFDDRMNHELLISELQEMRQQQVKFSKRQRKPSLKLFEAGELSQVEDEQELNGCMINVVEGGRIKEVDYESIEAMSSAHGLPPLPKSLSGFTLVEATGSPRTRGHLVYPPHPPPISPPWQHPPANLDAQLAILRREMYSLRQLDLSLLSQLWSLNESIHEFRQLLQDQEERQLSAPSPTPSSSTDQEGDQDVETNGSGYMYVPAFRTPPPPPVPARRTSNASRE